MTFPTQEELAREHVLIYFDPTKHPATDHYFHQHGYVDTLGSYHTSRQHHYHGLYTGGVASSDAHNPAEHDVDERLAQPGWDDVAHGDDPRMTENKQEDAP